MKTKRYTSKYDAINHCTGFAEGELFDDAADVRAYFTVQSQIEMFGADAITSQELLDEMASEVIENRWHMKD